MNEQLLIGLFTLAGTLVGGLIGGWFTVRAARIGYKKETMEKEIRKLASQVKSYWFLEKEYLSQITELNNDSIPEDTVMKATRKKVENNGNDYPNMTANEANSILRKYE